MGVCCSSFEPVAQVALKFPGGTRGIRYDSGAFVPCDINSWIREVSHSSTWTSWVCYNDDSSGLGIPQTRKGHCKGVLSWNTERIAWLIHSVPNFPRIFNSKTISELEPGEHIYGQSFFHITLPYSDALLRSVLGQIHYMQAHTFMKQGTIPEFPRTNRIETIRLTDDILHIAKPPSVKTDIYGHLASTYPHPWYVRTWRRGHPIPYTGIHDIELTKHDTTEWSGGSDHSKWAVSDELTWFGDLNRMSSQSNRGGGGVIIRNAELARTMKDLAQTWITGVSKV